MKKTAKIDKSRQLSRLFKEVDIKNAIVRLYRRRQVRYSLLVQEIEPMNRALREKLKS